MNSVKIAKEALLKLHSSSFGGANNHNPNKKTIKKQQTQKKYPSIPNKKALGANIEAYKKGAIIRKNQKDTFYDNLKKIDERQAIRNQSINIKEYLNHTDEFKKQNKPSILLPKKTKKWDEAKAKQLQKDLKANLREKTDWTDRFALK